MKAVLLGTVIALSDNTIFLEGNHYFPPESVEHEYIKESPKKYTCPWKGDARYYHIVLSEGSAEDAAWSYPEPKEAAHDIAGRFAFDKEKVEIKEE